MGNLGGSPQIRMIDGQLTLKVELHKLGAGAFYHPVPTETLQAELNNSAPGLIADGVNVYLLAEDGTPHRIAYTDSNHDFIYTPDGTPIQTTQELEQHLRLAASIYVAYATAHYRHDELPIPGDVLRIRPASLRQAEAIAQSRIQSGTSKETNGLAEMLLAKRPDVSFEDIGGQEPAVATCRRFAEQLRFPETYATQSSKPPRGILLYGPPGTGKTLLAKAIAAEADAQFIHVQASDIAGEGLYGQAEKAVSMMFSEAKRLAENQHVIIFVDEGDLLLPRKTGTSGSGRHEATGKTVGIFAQAMDGMNSSSRITVIISTNEPGDLDPRILSRMDEVQHVPLPTASGLKEILTIHLHRLHESSPQVNLDPTVDITPLSQQAFSQGLSGRDIADALSLIARIRGQKQLNLIREAIKSGQIPIPADSSEAQVISTISRQMITGNTAGIDHLILGPITQSDIEYVINHSKQLLQTQKKREFGFLAVRAQTQ